MMNLTAARAAALLAAVATAAFAIAPAHAGAVYSQIYAFQGNSDGAYPYAGLTSTGGTFYGTTYQGGSNTNCPIGGCGTVYSVTPAGIEKVLYAFQGAGNGEYPVGGLTLDGDVFYGTTQMGGGDGCFEGSGCGTVFSITTSGVQQVINTFKGRTNAQGPWSNLLRVGNNLYGTSEFGGTNYPGTVYVVGPDGHERVIHSFGGTGDGQYPLAGLVNVGGTLYETTQEGGGSGCGGVGCGIIYSVTPQGVEKVIYSFNGGVSDGGLPESGLINVGGTLYGTTEVGGSGNCTNYYDTTGCGTVFSITTAGVEKIVYAFQNGSDGSLPAAGLVNVSGVLYGTANLGGGSGCGGSGCGTIYSVTPTGVLSVIYDFQGGSDGAYPQATPINLKGTLYGTTYGGGNTNCDGGCGTVYKVKL